MADFTIGEVAGAINVGLIFLQITLPLLQALVLVVLVHRTESAITWQVSPSLLRAEISLPSVSDSRRRSVLSRTIHSTHWPSILATDASAGRRDGVARRVVVMDYMALISTIILLVAGVLTPVGLGDTIELGPSINATFTYAPDPSAFGSATPDRDGYSACRVCDAGELPCPGVSSSDTIFIPTPWPATIYQNYIPRNITECFASGVQNDLRVSPFQIEYRTYWTSDNEVNTTARSNTTGDFSMIESLVLLNEIAVIEGLIVDEINGGIGFRNHTIPTHPLMTHGAIWSEDLLWIELDTVCEETNWSIEYQIYAASLAGFSNLQQTTKFLVYKGDVATLNTTEFPSIDTTNAQLNPDLRGRANLAGRMFTSHVIELITKDLGAFNISEDGRFDVSSNSSGTLNSALNYYTSDHPGLLMGVLSDPPNNSVSPEYLQLDPTKFNLSHFDVQAFMDFYFTSETPAAPVSAFRLFTSPSFADALTACQGFKPGDEPNINVLSVGCGYVITPPHSLQDSQASVNIQTTWSQSIQVCSSAPRAVIKEVQFQYNGSGVNPSLSSLTVMDVKTKQYSTNSQKPMWAVENPGPGWNISTIRLLWGIVNESYTQSEDLWIIQNDHLYLPAYVPDPLGGGSWGDSMASSRAPTDVLLQIYNWGSFGTLGIITSSSEYDGTQNYRMMQKWLNLTSSTETTSKIPNLIWTDIAANMLVGTKSVVSAQPIPTRSVRIHRRRITYNYVFAIPGLLCLSLWLGWAVAYTGMLISPRSRPYATLSHLKTLTNQLSVGRALAAVGSPSNHTTRHLSTKEWIVKVGGTKIDLMDTGTKEQRTSVKEKTPYLKDSSSPSEELTPGADTALLE